MAISFEEVSYSYDREHNLLDRFSLTLPEQGVLCLFGPSGCGKTTLLRLLAGLAQPDSGHISGLEGLKPAVVFQENRLLPWNTVVDNVAVVMSETVKSAATKAASERLRRLGLGDVLNKYPEELSGGMKRRVAIARALAVKADFLLLDEPFEGLEAALWPLIAREIRESYADKPVILVTHIADQATIMNAQILKLSGPPLQKVPD